MEQRVWKKTPFIRLVIAAVLGVGTATAPLVVLMLGGLIQFNIIRIVGAKNVTSVFGLASGISSLSIVITGPLGGVIADKTHLKFGRRRFWMIVGSICGALSMLGLTYASSIPVLIATWCLAQFFYGMVSLSCFAIVPEQVEPEKFGRISGIIAAAAPVFVMSSQMVMGIFASTPIQQKLIAIIILQLFGGIVAALLVRDNYFERNSVEKKEKTSFAQKFKGFYPSARKYPEFTWALFTKLCINIANAGLTLLTLFYIARFHFSETKIFQINAITSPSIMAMVVAGIVGGFLSDKIKKQKIFVIVAALVTGVCLVIFAFSYNITFVIIAYFIFNFGFGMYGAVDNALVNRILPSKEQSGKDIAIMNATTQLSSSLVNFVAPSLIALGVSLFGGDGYTFFFLLVAVFSLLSAIFVMPIPEVAKENK